MTTTQIQKLQKLAASDKTPEYVRKELIEILTNPCPSGPGYLPPYYPPYPVYPDHPYWQIGKVTCGDTVLCQGGIPGETHYTITSCS